MNNTERLLLYTLPRWAGVTVLTVEEPLNDMWISGEQAGHHADRPYDAEGFVELRKELLKDFLRAPVADSFRPDGVIRTIRDLDAAMADIRQTPVPSPPALLAMLLPRDELAKLTQAQPRTATRSHQKITPRTPRTSRSKRPKKSPRDR